MEKHCSPDTSLFWYVLSEDEWYGTGVNAKELQLGVVNDAKAKNCRYASIFVVSDPVMSIAPTPGRHLVYKWSAEEIEQLGRVRRLTPAAWRVKDFADGWILCHTREQAEREAEGAGNLIEALYTLKELGQ